MLMKRFLFLLMCLACSLVASAQQRVMGTVADTDGNPIVGANVIVAGTTSGTTTDTNGQFVISTPPRSALQISYLGYETRTIEVGHRTSLDVKLESSALAMDEVVVLPCVPATAITYLPSAR